MPYKHLFRLGIESGTPSAARQSLSYYASRIVKYELSKFYLIYSKYFWQDMLMTNVYLRNKYIQQFLALLI